MSAKIPTIECKGRKWKVWIVDETDVTITVSVRPLRVMKPFQFTMPFRREFNTFSNLATEAVDRYLAAPVSSLLNHSVPWSSRNKCATYPQEP
jgi:hypothetical protein